ncbi:bifunctional diguanylate cyclase/phosphodiesterase [Vibrio ouci]|uniref:EAL domain-containing protein n=1 Tax=Vibrio ouci TaxID=2499078 RepID=A0A4Y8WID0_9VIBR|nr:EAL domain-containing protein [Vibrio ouci]TFH92677.1 EAL domain-containing protein [Vibrio ouci]
MKLALSLKTLVLIWFIGLSSAVASYVTVHYYETQKLNGLLDNQLNNRVQTLSQSLKAIETLLYSTRSFLANGNSPTPQQFESYFSDQVGINTMVHSLMWAPNVAVDKVSEFERKAQQQGFLGYRLNPKISTNNDPVWFLQNSTLPIYFISSSFEGSDYLGYRLESDPTIVSAMSRSISGNRIGVVDYVEEGQLGARLLLPKFGQDGALDGFVVANIILHELLGEIWHTEVNSSHTGISVFTKPNDIKIFESHINTKLEEDKFSTRIVSASRTVRIPLFNTKWQLSISKTDRTGSTALYGFTSVFLILMLTVSATIAANFYATRLKVSDQVIEEKTRSLALQAVRDNLTNLSNRTALSSEVDKQLSLLSSGQSKGFSILFIDLDRFKVINDSMGHLHGDKLLQKVASRLTQHCRRNDMSFRFGGDEFVICLPGLTSKDALSDICQRYSNVLSQPYNIDGQSCHIGTSIGISVVTDPMQTLASILREADTAMYKAKTSTHEKVVFFHEQMFNQAKKRFTLEQELTNALNLKQLSLVYQPIYSTVDDRVVGFESLLRWVHPEFGAISPVDFVPIAEETGLVVKIGNWVAMECCKTLQRLWQARQGKSVPRININVSAKQFESEHIYHTLCRLLSECDFPPHLIGIEITESMLLSDECSAQQLQRIKDLGVVLYLDDFGTGYSSLSVLNDYPVDVIKVDRSFVSRIAMGQSNADSLCQAIINMAHIIDLEVVAEGVETPEQLAVLSQHKCNYIQGYLKSKPLSVCSLENVLDQQAQLTA